MPYEQDADGTWWYRNKKQRTRCGFYTCDNCGGSFHRMPSIASQARDGKTKFCSRRCSNEVTAEIHRTTRRGPGGPMWKGGRNLDGSGYVRLWKPDHPDSNCKGYMQEHRLVMEQILGRRLKSFETVHHINGKRSDNRPENLELWASKHPPGQKCGDLIKWAKEILSLYEPGALSSSPC